MTGGYFDEWFGSWKQTLLWCTGGCSAKDLHELIMEWISTSGGAEMVTKCTSMDLLIWEVFLGAAPLALL